MQRDGAEACAGHHRGRLVGVVRGVEREHAVAGLADAEHGGGDRLGGAHRDLHLGRGVELDPVEALLVLGDRVPERRDAR